MQVGINAYLLHDGNDYRSAGVSTYIRQLLIHLPRVAPHHHFAAFHGKDSTPPSGVVPYASALATDRPVTRILCEQVVLPLAIRRRKIDVVHGPVNVVPLLASVPSVVTVHDLAFVRFPERFHVAKAAYLRAAVSLSLRRARQIIAVSNHTRSDLVNVLGARAEMITVVHSGVAPMFCRLDGNEIARFREHVFGGTPFLLHVGTLEPRKNLDVLIRAFAHLKRHSQIPHHLALAGAKGWMYENIFRLVTDLGLEDDITFLGYISPDELPLWYNCADLFVYPSAYEGFGLPVLEAMACGLPVVTSDSSGLRELAGDACLTVEPGSQEALQVAIARVVQDATLHDELRRRGLERAQLFSWDQSARATVEVYERALAGVAPC